MFQREQNTLFCDNWAAIGFGKDNSEPGMVKPVNFLGIPMIIGAQSEKNNQCVPQFMPSPGYDTSRGDAKTSRITYMPISRMGL